MYLFFIEKRRRKIITSYRQVREILSSSGQTTLIVQIVQKSIVQQQRLVSSYPTALHIFRHSFFIDGDQQTPQAIPVYYVLGSHNLQL